MVKCKLAHVGEVGFACPPLEDVLGGPNTCTCQGLLRLVGRAADNLARIMRIVCEWYTRQYSMEYSVFESLWAGVSDRTLNPSRTSYYIVCSAMCGEFKKPIQSTELKCGPGTLPGIPIAGIMLVLVLIPLYQYQALGWCSSVLIPDLARLPS